jgi:predicted CopG family antitoxin
MRINHVRNELKSLSDVIASLINTHKRELADYNTQASERERNLTEREGVTHSQQEWDALHEINLEKHINTQPLKVIESLAKLQNELILVKHVALI